MLPLLLPHHHHPPPRPDTRHQLGESDVFIWPSVERSIGIISGCLPTVRALKMHIPESWFKITPSSRKSSSEKSSEPHPLSPLETISKKRTRKTSKRDDLESTNFTNSTQLEDEVEVDERSAITVVAKDGKKDSYSGKKDRDHSGTWRPDKDEMCLTTTTIHRSASMAGAEERSMENLARDGITMTKKFEWNEALRH